MQVDSYTSESGTNALFIHQPGNRASTLQMWFQAGSALEQHSEQGVAHFLEHMFFKGTENRPGHQIAHEVESTGAELNAFTSFDYTCYYINSPNDRLNSNAEILMDMVGNPQFSIDELVPERGVVLEEYRRALDNPSQFGFMKLQELAFQGGYQHPILGTPRTIEEFSREQVLDFRKRYYNRQNALFIIAGDLNEKNKLKAMLDRFELPSGSSSNFGDFSLKSDSQVGVHQKDVKHITMTLCFSAPEYLTPNAAAEDLALNAIAHGESSPLVQELVVEDGSATSVAGSTMFFSRGGVHFIRMTFPVEKAKKAVGNLQKQLRVLAAQGLQYTHLKKIKEQYIASKVYERETMESFAFSLGHGFAQNSDIYCEDKFIDQIKEVDVESANRALVDLLKREVSISFQVPNEEDPKKYENLGADVIGALQSVKGPSTKGQVNAPKSSDFDSSVKSIKLKSGIDFIHKHNTISPTFAMHIYLQGGLAMEEEDRAGANALLGRLLNYQYPGQEYQDLKTRLDTLSASIHGFSGKNAYGLTIHGRVEHLQELVEHAGFLLLEPTFTKEHFELERELMKRGLEASEKEPSKILFRMVNSKIFGKHHYARSIQGDAATLKKISRKYLLDYHMDGLAERGMLISFSGSTPIDEVQELVTKEITDYLPTRKSKTFRARSFKLKGDKTLHLDFEREQTQIFIGIPTRGLQDPSDLALKMLTTHLSGQSSELFVDLRDKRGLCYAVQPIHQSALEGGFWGIYLASGNDKLEEALGAVHSLIERIAQESIPQEDFERIKKVQIGQQALQLQTNDDYIGHYSIPALHQLGMDFSNLSQKEMAAMSYPEFCRCIKEHLNGQLLQVTVGTRPKN